MSLTIPLQIWYQIWIYSIPMIIIMINANTIHMTYKYYWIASIGSVVSEVIKDSLLKLWISNILAIHYIILKYVSYKYSNYLYSISYGFIINFIFSTKFLVTPKEKNNIFKILKFIIFMFLFIGVCYEDLYIIDIISLISLFYSLFIGTRTISDEYIINQQNLYKILKEKITDERLRLNEFREMITKNYSEKYIFNINLHYMLYFTSNNKLLFLFSFLGNILLEWNIPYLNFIIITNIILDLPWELLIFFNHFKRHNISLSLFISGIIDLFIKLL